MKERFAAADLRFLTVCLVLLGGCVWFTAGNFYRAFPEASIDFRVTRAGAAPIAQHFLQAQGYRLDGYRDASSFTYDDDVKTFLEREAGLERANQLMGSRVHLWRWSFRWFRPLQKAIRARAGRDRLRADFLSVVRAPQLPGVPARDVGWRRLPGARGAVRQRQHRARSTGMDRGGGCGGGTHLGVRPRAQSEELRIPNGRR